jgi:phospholipase/carboxylesterase
MHAVTDIDASSGRPCGAVGAATAWVEAAGEPRVGVLLLHGLDMAPAQLARLVRSLKLPALVALPSGPIERVGGHRAWWPVDDVARAARLLSGPSDLHDSHPPGRDRARDAVHVAAQALRERAPGLPLVVAGFSQGAMLALDCVFQAPSLDVDALALWSASRLAFSEWAPALHRLRGVRIDLLHGRSDANLGIAAGLSLRDALVAEDADVRWSPFDGGHEIPLQAWVGLRRLVRELAAAAADPGDALRCAGGKPGAA